METDKLQAELRATLETLISSDYQTIAIVCRTVEEADFVRELLEY